MEEELVVVGATGAAGEELVATVTPVHSEERRELCERFVGKPVVLEGELDLLDTPCDDVLFKSTVLLGDGVWLAV